MAHLSQERCTRERAAVPGVASRPTPTCCRGAEATPCAPAERVASSGAMAAPCPRCSDAANPSDARFCRRCGASLTGPTEPVVRKVSPPPSAPPPVSRGRLPLFLALGCLGLLGLVVAGAAIAGIIYWKGLVAKERPRLSAPEP